jgi:hypothetical protein
MIDQSAPVTPTVQLRLRAPGEMQWTAEETLPRLEVTPATGPILNSPTVTIIPAQLSPGWQQGQITFTASNNDGDHYSKSMPVKAYLGNVKRTYLPLTNR